MAILNPSAGASMSAEIGLLAKETLRFMDPRTGPGQNRSNGRVTPECAL